MAKPVRKSTRERLLLAAEDLFAERGFSGSTLREVTERAGVNLAGVNYHFGSKEALFREMLKRRVAPINQRRMELLDAALEKSAGLPLTLEELFSIILDPLSEALTARGGVDETFLGIIARSILDTSDFVQQLHRAFFQSISERFTAELVRALGGISLSEEKISWRIYFSLSAMLGSLIQHRRIEPYFPAIQDSQDFRILTQELIEFVCGGLRAEAREAEMRIKGARP